MENGSLNFTNWCIDGNRTYPCEKVEIKNWPALLLFIIVIIAIWGNVFVCLAVWREQKLKNMFNYFLVSLATSDMLCASLIMPVGIIKEVQGKQSKKKLPAYLMLLYLKRY